MADMKCFRWRGPGMLTIGRKDGLKCIPPYTPGEVERACLVKDPVSLEALGAARIQSLIDAGQAEAVAWSDNIMSFLKPDDPNSLVLADVQAAEVELGKTYAFDSAVAEQTAKLAESMSPAEKEAASYELRKMGLGATAKIATLGPDRPALTPAGPDKA